MQLIKRKIEIILLLLAMVSAVMVGVSVGSPALVAVGVCGAVCGFVVTDRLQLFSLEGWFANIASLAILYLVFCDFNSGDQTQKLTAVAQLLVYLQTILMFQPKTTRLAWQILTLSLLQVSIAAIFTLEFEAGILFLVYFGLAGVAMMLQTIYCQQDRILHANRRSAARENDYAEPLMSAKHGQPIVKQELTKVVVRPTDNRVFQFGLWLCVSGVFAAIAFFVLPRHASPWYGPAVHQVATAGMMSAVDLEQRGKVRMSKEIVFRAEFENEVTGDPVRNMDAPYFRAIAFSKTEIKDGRTSFTAPYDRVYPDVYQRLPVYKGDSRRIRQIITLEKTTDPLVYGVTPVYMVPDVTPEELEFCHEISAYTRCREEQEISVAPYKYETATLLDHRGRFLKSWPYISNVKKPTTKYPLANDEEYRSWLVKMDRGRYPGLVAAADRIADESANRGRLALVQEMESFFQQQEHFKYTLDFSNVRMDSRVDPIEDFFSNHHTGHCELYAAALTLMLRSQDIPARLVVGFYGGEYNSLTQSYFVRGTHAHAWVEVYLRPEDCTQQMILEGAAGSGGAWKILDASPADNASSRMTSGGTAMEMARSYWQDYVLGMERADSRNSAASVPDSLVAWMASLDVERIDQRLTQIRKTASNPRTQWMVLLGVAALVLMRAFARSAWEALGVGWRQRKRKRRIVLLFADAISAIAPRLGDWVHSVSGDCKSTQFYQRLLRLLAKQGVVRSEMQTHRDFARDVAKRFANHKYGSSIGKIVSSLTEHYNAVRFGDHDLGEVARGKISDQLDALQVAINEAPLIGNDDLGSMSGD